ncbi:MAG: precorrin-6y C5,15-methyltransferase (decarboxylating) subunit CbiE [Tissierella sp.]|uniref:precorrin-6y C5,15-methyltransferase (decarboxylating) subunit CbiE n=1 Tax=Tissierella sp. TaxID=41274 RepID=UPI003F9C7CE2
MLKIAGIGPGNPKYLTGEVLEEIKNSDYTLAFKRVKDSLRGIDPDIIEVKRVADLIEHLEKEKDLLLLATGDPNFYGIVDFIKRKGIGIEKVYPGLSSFQYLMGSLQKSWTGASFLSLHGRKDSLSGKDIDKLTVILTDKENTPSYICKRLDALNVKGKIHVGFNLSHDDEFIVTKNIGEKIEDISSLAVVVIEREMD